MCGRVVQKGEPEELREIIDPKRIFTPITPRYNIAPSQLVPLIRIGTDNEMELQALKWGLVPHWAKPDKKVTPQINARAEGIESKPFFRSAFKKHRCLIPVSGFYEWKRDGEKKQPIYIHRADGRLFYLAGVWDKAPEGDVPTFAIITTEPNQLLSTIHNRMPVIIDRIDFDSWLKGDSVAALNCLKSFRDGELEAYPVSTVVNSPKHDSEECIRTVNS